MKKQIDLEKIEHCGQCQMSLNETALLCDVKYSDLLKGNLAKVYMKGKLEAELSVRRSLVIKAQDGDTSAQKEFLKLANESRIEIE